MKITTLKEYFDATDKEIKGHIKSIVKNVEGYTINGALDKNILQAMDIPTEIKLACFKNTPKKITKKHPSISIKVGNSRREYEYIPIRNMERALNFVFNFDRSAEITDSGFEQYKDKKERTIFDARTSIKFSCKINGKEITKTAFGSWKMYNNPQNSKFTAKQASYSQALKNVAKQFGIGSDLNSTNDERTSGSVELVNMEKEVEGFEAPSEKHLKNEK